MKTTAKRASDFTAWLSVQAREAREITNRVAEELRLHLQEELAGLLAVFEARAVQAGDDRERIALGRARELLGEFVDPRTAGERPHFVMLDCATCAAQGKLGVSMECVAAEATSMTWAPFLDNEGRTHAHDPNRRGLGFKCSAGHVLIAQGTVACWCGWKAPAP